MADSLKTRYLRLVKRPNQNSVPAFIQRRFRMQDGSSNQLSRSGSSFASSDGSSASQTSPDHTMNKKNGGASGGGRGDTAKKKRSLSLKGILRNIGDHFRGQPTNPSLSPRGDGTGEHSDEWLAVNCNLTCEELANLMTEFKAGHIGQEEIWNKVHEREREKRRVQGSMTLAGYTPTHNGGASRDQPICSYTGERKRDRHIKGTSVPAFPHHRDYDTPTEEAPPPFYDNRIHPMAPRWRGEEEQFMQQATSTTDSDREDHTKLVNSSSSSASLMRSPSPSPSRGSQRLESPPDRSGVSSGSSHTDLSRTTSTSSRTTSMTSRGNDGSSTIVRNLSVCDNENCVGGIPKRLSSDSRLMEDRPLPCPHEPVIKVNSMVVANDAVLSSDENNEDENHLEEDEFTLSTSTTNSIAMDTNNLHSSGSVSVSGAGPIGYWNTHSQDPLPPAPPHSQGQPMLTRVPEEGQGQMPPYLQQQMPKKSLKVMISSRSPRLLRKFTRSPIVVYTSRGGAANSWGNAPLSPSPFTSPEGSLSGNERGSDSPSSSLGRSTVSSTTSERSDFSSSDGPSTRRQQSQSPDVQLKPTLFCSVARAKMDYIPSPYDNGALAFKKSDLIYITRKPSGGYWEGVCQNRSGKFKFTFVEELSQEEMPGLEGGNAFPLGTLPLGPHQASASYVLHLQSVEQLLRRIECEKYLSDFVTNDLASLEKFKNLTESDLDNLEITNLEHRVKLLTVAKLLLEPIKGLEVPVSSSGESPVPTPTPSPRVDEAELTSSIHKLRIAARDSGFYASTDAGLCGDHSQSPGRSKLGKNNISSLEMLRESGLGSLCAEEEEATSATEVSGVLAPGSNCNNSNNAISGILIPGVDGHYLRMCDQYSGLIDPSGWGGEVPKDKPLKPVRTDVKAVDLLARHAQFAAGDPTPVKVSAAPHATHSAPHPMHSAPHPTHTAPPPQILENYYEFPWVEDPSLHKTHHSAFHSPTHHHHQVHSRLIQQRASSPVLMVNLQQRTDQNQLQPVDTSFVQWKRSSSIDGSITCSNGCSNGWSSGVNGVLPSPQLVRAVGQTDTCPPALLLNSRRRKSRSVSPHKRHNLQKDTVTRESREITVHASPTLPLRRLHAGLGMHSHSLEKLLESKLMADGIDMRHEPYSDPMGFCGIPPALIQRYAEEVQMRVPDVAVCLEALRVKSLIAEGRCWFRSDALAHQAQHVIYAGRGSTVYDWLTYLGLPMYVDAFIGGGWDTLDILMDMEEEDLRRCGVADPKHIRRLHTALEHLKMSAKV